MNKYALGNNINARLRQQNKSQRRMATDLDISEKQISNYVCGNMYPSVKNLYRIAEYLGCTIDELMEGTFE